MHATGTGFRANQAVAEEVCQGSRAGTGFKRSAARGREKKGKAVKMKPSGYFWLTNVQSKKNKVHVSNKRYTKVFNVPYLQMCSSTWGMHACQITGSPVPGKAFVVVGGNKDSATGGAIRLLFSDQPGPLPLCGNQSRNRVWWWRWQCR